MATGKFPLQRCKFVKAQLPSWYRPLLVRRFFWLKLRQSLEHARLAHIEQLPDTARRPGTIREFVKSFDETHAKQLDDVRLGSRNPSRRRLSARSFGLLRRKIFEAHLSSAMLADVDEAFAAYSAMEDLRVVAVASNGAREQLAPELRAIFTRAAGDDLQDADVDDLISFITQEQAQQRRNELTTSVAALLSEATAQKETPSVGLLVAVIATLICSDAFMRRDAFSFDYFAHVAFDACNRHPLTRGLEASLIGFSGLLKALEEQPDAALEQLELLADKYTWLRSHWTGTVSQSGNIEVVLLGSIYALVARLTAALQRDFQIANERHLAMHQRAIEIFNSVEYQRTDLPHQKRSALLDFRCIVSWSQVKMRGDDSDRREAIAAIEEAWELLATKRILGLYDVGDFFNGLLVGLTRSGLHNSMYLAAGLAAEAYRAAGAFWIEETYEDIAQRSLTESIDDETDRDEPTLTRLEYSPLLEIIRSGGSIIN